MDRKDRIRAYKATVPEAGVYCIRNTRNGKVFFGSARNLHGMLERHRFMLQLGSHTSADLQKDWREFGEEAFTFEILEKLPLAETPDHDYSEDLSILEQIWIDTLQPFGENGYNRNRNIRL